MTSSRPNPVVRLFPSLTDVAFLLPIMFLFVRLEGARTLLGDGDTGWHVRAGEWILQNHRIPHTDFFSYTMPGQPWFAWEWLWELSFGWLHQHWGMEAVLIASIVVLCLTFALLFRLVRRACQNPFLALGVTALAAAGSSVHWLARPHLFTVLFVVIFAWVIELAGASRRRLLWILPFLMAVWVNVHGAFLAGFLMLAAYIAGDLVCWMLDADRARRLVALQRAGALTVAALACGAATLLNPYTYHLHVHIYQYLMDAKLWQEISEYLPFEFRGPVALFSEPMFVLAIVAAAWNVYRRRFGTVFLLLGWAHLAVYAVRNLPIFLVLAAPPIAETVGELLEMLKRAPVRNWIPRLLTQFEEVADEFGALDRIPRFHLMSGFVLAVLAMAFYAPSRPYQLRGEYDPKHYPAKALSLLRSPDVHRIFTHDEWGDYLIYSLYPVKKVFVDGRSDFYGPAFDQTYMDVMQVKNNWEQNLNRYSVDTILLPVDASLTGALKQSRKWRPVYDDGMAIVFRSAGPPSLRDPSGEGRRISSVRDSNEIDSNATATRGGNVTAIPTPRMRS